MGGQRLWVFSKARVRSLPHQGIDIFAIKWYCAALSRAMPGKGSRHRAGGLTNWAARHGAHDCRLLAPAGLDHVADRQRTMGWARACIPPALSGGGYGGARVTRETNTEGGRANAAAAPADMSAAGSGAFQPRGGILLQIRCIQHNAGSPIQPTRAIEVERFGRVGRRADRKGRCGPVSSRLPSACRSKTTLGDDVALARKRYRRPLHQATGRWVERFPAMHRDAIVPQQRIADLPVVAIDELRPGRELIDLIEQSRTGRIVHPLDTDRCRRVEVKRLSAGCRVAMHQRVKDGRRLALGFLRDHLVDALVASEPLGIAEDCAPALDRVLEAIGEEGVGGAQIHPGGCSALWWQLERVEHGSGRWVQHVGLIRVPLDLSVAQAADWLRLRILQIGD